MSPNNSSVSGCVAVIDILQAGVDFYVDAIDYIEDRHIKLLFIQMISYRESTVQELLAFAAKQQCELKQSGAIVAKIEQQYSQLAKNLAYDKQCSFVTCLKITEDEVLDGLDKLVTKSHSQIDLHCIENFKQAVLNWQNEISAVTTQQTNTV